ncbi:MAG: ribosome silencing factor [Treponema sp.]|jgi:ribosome-associated protein|nr:ribosome silencing factor [Treponema sp.]
MDDTLKVEQTRLKTGRMDAAATAMDLGRLLHEHNGVDVVIIDLRELSMWTDFFVIATVTSGAHLLGLQRRIKDFAVENSLPILHGNGKKTAGGDGWNICDLGFMAVHLMTEATRAFYELENLWNGGVLIKL